MTNKRKCLDILIHWIENKLQSAMLEVNEISDEIQGLIETRTYYEDMQRHDNEFDRHNGNLGINRMNLLLWRKSSELIEAEGNRDDLGEMLHILRRAIDVNRMNDRNERLVRNET